MRRAKKNFLCLNTEKGKTIEQKLSPLLPLTLAYISIHNIPTWSKISCLHINGNKWRTGKGRKLQRYVRLYQDGKFPLDLIPQKFVCLGKILCTKILDRWGAFFSLKSKRLILKLKTWEMGTVSIEIKNLEIDSLAIISPYVPLGEHSCLETYTSVREILY